MEKTKTPKAVYSSKARSLLARFENLAEKFPQGARVLSDTGEAGPDAAGFETVLLSPPEGPSAAAVYCGGEAQSAAFFTIADGPGPARGKARPAASPFDRELAAVLRAYESAFCAPGEEGLLEKREDIERISDLLWMFPEREARVEEGGRAFRCLMTGKGPAGVSEGQGPDLFLFAGEVSDFLGGEARDAVDALEEELCAPESPAQGFLIDR